MARIAEAMTWFRLTFGHQIERAVAGTPLTLDLLTAIAYQETGDIWHGLFDRLSTEELLAVCVGDTIDAPRRKAFPKNKADLLSKPHGAEMFTLAHQALVDMAAQVHGYQTIAANPAKFCHGYGLFQFDLQFFLSEPDYFLQEKWKTFDGTLGKAVSELKEKLKKIYPEGKATLTQEESVFLAIAYNTGGVNFSKGFKQGFKDGAGVYYGEHIAEYFDVARTLPTPPAKPALRLILGKHPSAASTTWVFRAMSSAKLVGNRFELDRAELQAFLGKTIPGAARQPLADMLRAGKFDFVVADKHKTDPDDPKIYVFASPTVTV